MSKVNGKFPKIGLALSAGGVRGIAQIAVIEQLEKAGIPIDVVVGSSAGSVVAACYGLGTLPELKKFLVSVRRRDLLNFIDVELAPNGFIKGYRIARQLKKLTKSKRLEESRIPVGVVSTEVKTGRTKIFRQGRPARPLMASCAMPIIFKPVKIKRKVYLDGGLSSYLPADACRQLGADFVIGIDCSQKGTSFWGKMGEIRQYQLNGLKGKWQKLRQADKKSLPQNELTRQYLSLWRQFYRGKKKNRLGFLSLLTNSLDIFAAQDYYRHKPDCDYLIKVDVKLLTFSFYKSRQSLRVGKKVGKKAALELKRFLNIV